MNIKKNADMQLIKDLGGYEKALEVSRSSSHALVDVKRYQVHVIDLKLALLNYRRENEMYATGDKLVIKNADIPNNEVIEIDRIGANGGIYDNQWRRLKMDYFRHASDAEIKANMRLI